jgi:hypothetical protein
MRIFLGCLAIYVFLLGCAEFMRKVRAVAGWLLERARR